jgi:hypothetical protein
MTALVLIHTALGDRHLRADTCAELGIRSGAFVGSRELELAILEDHQRNKADRKRRAAA